MRIKLRMIASVKLKTIASLYETTKYSTIICFKKNMYRYIAKISKLFSSLIAPMYIAFCDFKKSAKCWLSVTQ